MSHTEERPPAPPQLSAAKRALLRQRLLSPSPSPAAGEVRRDVGSGPAPLSVAQEHLWYMTQLAPSAPVYNEVVSFRKSGPFDLEAFRQAFNEIVRRHDAWRTTFSVHEGEPAQVVHPFFPFDLPLLDLSHLPRAEALKGAEALAGEEARALYDLETGPLLRPLLVRLAEDDHRLYLALHHLVFDGASLYRVVLPQLAAFYESFSTGGEPGLPEGAASYRDYSLWSRTWCDGPVAAARAEHWRRRLSEVPALALPLDHPRPAIPAFVGRNIGSTVPAPCAERLRQLAQESGSTLFQVLAAAFAVFLHRYSGQEDVVFATAADLRQRPEFESLVGFMVTPLVLRCDLSGDPSFQELLARVRDEVIDAMDNLVPFGLVVRAIRPTRALAATPVFQAMMVLEPGMVTADASWSLHREIDIDNAVGNAKFDLDLELDERPGGEIGLRLAYDAQIFDAGTAEQMSDHFLRLLSSVTEDPSRPISTLPLLGPEDRRRQLVDWNRTEADYRRTACVQDLVAEQAALRPEAPAASFAQDTLTYRELDRRANALALRLRAAGAEPGRVVGVCVDRSLEMIIGLLAILKCGAAYLPLDPSHPADRLAFIIGDAGASLVLGEPASAGWVLGQAGGPAFVELGAATEEADEPPPSGAGPEDLMYVLYTSGSTGRPKGVPVRQRSVVNLLTSMARVPGMTKDDRGAALATIAFDMATSDLWLPLVTGAQIALASREIARDARRLAEFIAEEDVTFMQATPTSWQMLLEAGWEGKADLVAISAGEPLNPALAEQLIGRCRLLWNAYGPTETTVWSTVGRVDAGGRITIGRPIANTRLYILDRRLEPVPAGVAGEIVIGGDGVATGYVNRPGETASRFLPDPHAVGGRAFRTGDIARFLPDGRIEHLGRLDDQIKLRGHRIEPGEIEAVLCSHPEVDAAVVMVRDMPEVGRSLVAYLVPRASTPPVPELRELLRTRLPSYMVPRYFVGLDELPLTSSGKVDRLSLPLPELGEQVRETPAVAPRSELEERLLPIWERVLGIGGLGTEDDFFELGGHSLLAVRLLAEVEGELGMSLPVITLFERGATVRGMASAIAAMRDSDGTAARPEAGVRVGSRHRGDGSLPRLFAIFPNETCVFSLRHADVPLAEEIDVVTLLAARLGQRLDRSLSLDDIVTSVLGEVRDVQGEGPYFLAGWSLGGLVAYEVAGRLQAEGESVAWLGVVDTPVPRKDTVARRLARLKTHGPKRASAVIRYARYRAGLVRARIRFAQDDFDMDGANRLLLAHALSGHDAPMDLFLTDRTAQSFDATAGWDQVHLGALRVHNVPGDHNSMYRPPHAATITKVLASSVTRAFAEQSGRP